MFSHTMWYLVVYFTKLRIYFVMLLFCFCNLLFLFVFFDLYLICYLFNLMEKMPK